MSRYLKQHEKELMKMAMLKQEQTFNQQVRELHRLYRVQKLLMTDLASTMPNVKCKPEDERHAQENEAGPNKSRDAYMERKKAPYALEEIDLELTLAIGSFGMAEKKATKQTSSSVDSRTSNSSSLMESGPSGSPDCRVLPPHSSHLGSSAVKASPTVGQHMEQKGLKQPPWLHQSLNMAR